MENTESIIILRLMSRFCSLPVEAEYAANHNAWLAFFPLSKIYIEIAPDRSPRTEESLLTPSPHIPPPLFRGVSNSCSRRSRSGRRSVLLNASRVRPRTPSSRRSARNKTQGTTRQRRRGSRTLRRGKPCPTTFPRCNLVWPPPFVGFLFRVAFWVFGWGCLGSRGEHSKRGRSWEFEERMRAHAVSLLRVVLFVF